MGKKEGFWRRLVRRTGVAAREPRKAFLWTVARANDALLVRRNGSLPLSDVPELEEVRRRSREHSDIGDHLETLFIEALRVQPKLIVELGVSFRANSTYALERVARRCGATMVSVDIVDCHRVAGYEKWFFVEEDDISFAKRFPAWCAERRQKPVIDVLFIDTSHQYEHTVKEIEHWFPFLAPSGRVFFHDTNLRTFYRRRDRSLGLAWNNERGVVRAIEEFFGQSFDERRDFHHLRNGWAIAHRANSNGLTMLERLPVPGL